MIALEQLELVLQALPDPAFILSRTGKYVCVFGGRDTRYYHDGSCLVGLRISDVIKPRMADWFLEQIARALASPRQLVVEEYELSNRDVKGLSEDGPKDPIWFEARIQALSFQVDDEDVVLWVASNISARHSLESRLRELVDTDQLSGLFNRRKLEYDLTAHYASWVEDGEPTSICMFDLDDFKRINDAKGHHAGDEIIQIVAHVCRTAFRDTDTVCRFGGDEFVVAMPDMALADAMLVAERLQRCLRNALRRFSVAGTPVTASIGVTSMTADDQSSEDTLRRADQALYKAKSLGKDRIASA